MRSSHLRVIWFVSVGCCAALTHLGVVIALVNQLHVAPLLANIVGWLVAFGVSFAGHFRMTFRAQQSPILQASIRFFMVSAAGFVINEAAYAVLLHFNWLPYDAGLAVVLIAVAIGTYVLSRHWAFKGIATR